MYRFDFNSTSQDLLDAFDADRERAAGVRPWISSLVVAVGVLFLAAAAGAAATDTAPLARILVWLIIGGSLVWYFAIVPRGERQHVRTSKAEQPLEVRFEDAGIEAKVIGVGTFERKWNELVGVLDAQRGVGLYFDDGCVHWLPERVFTHEEERRALLAFIEAQR